MSSEKKYEIKRLLEKVLAINSQLASWDEIPDKMKKDIHKYLSQN